MAVRRGAPEIFFKGFALLGFFLRFRDLVKNCREIQLGLTSVSVVRALIGADALLGQLYPHLEQVRIVGSCEEQPSGLFIPSRNTFLHKLLIYRIKYSHGR